FVFVLSIGLSFIVTSGLLREAIIRQPQEKLALQKPDLGTLVAQLRAQAYASDQISQLLRDTPPQEACSAGISFKDVLHPAEIAYLKMAEERASFQEKGADDVLENSILNSESELFKALDDETKQRFAPFQARFAVLKSGNTANISHVVVDTILREAMQEICATC